MKQKRKEYEMRNREKIRERDRKYRVDYNIKNKDRISNYRKKYWSSEKGKEVWRKKKAKRRELGYIPLMNNILPEEIPIQWHHINNLFVIPIPKEFHQNNLGLKHKEICNKWIEKYYNINLKKLLEE